MTVIRDLTLTEACLLTELHREHRIARVLIRDIERESHNMQATGYIDAYAVQWITTKHDRLKAKAERCDTLREMATWLRVDKALIERALRDEDLTFMATPEADQ